MSIWGRKVSPLAVVAAAAVMIVAAGLLPVLTKAAPARELTLVARGMAFYLEDDPKIPNPAIEAAPGETLRVVLRNRDRGMTHDFAVPAAGAGTASLSWNEEAVLTFEAPSDPGTYEYVCRPHLLMMKGRLIVRE